MTQREIRFRAWDKKEGKMIYANDKLRGGINSELGVGMNGEPLELNYEPYYPSISEIQGIVFMQYTGLQDKHGKEIWEGDIIKDPQTVMPFVVEWEGAGFNIEKGGMEVIGNIYESPELLST